MKFLCLALVLSSAAAMNAPSADELQALDAHIKGLSLVPRHEAGRPLPRGHQSDFPQAPGKNFLIFYSYE